MICWWSHQKTENLCQFPIIFLDIATKFESKEGGTMGELSQIPFLRDTVHVTLQVMAMKHWDRRGYQVPKAGKWWIYENHVLMWGHGRYCKMVEHETSEWLRQVFAVSRCTTMHSSLTICWFFGPGEMAVKPFSQNLLVEWSQLFNHFFAYASSKFFSNKQFVSRDQLQ